MTTKILRCPTVQAKSGRSRSSLYADIAAGVFVPPVKIGLRASGWPEHEVEAILASRVAGKSDEEIRALVRDLVSARSNAA